MYPALITAIRTLTILPMPGRESQKLAPALFGFPVVGALLGLLVLGFIRGFEWLIAPLGIQVEVILIMVLLAWLTGKLHWDGLADWADSKGAGRNKEKALAIMKDSCVGAYGVTALVLYGLLWSQLAVGLLSSAHGELIFLVFLFSRTLQVELICVYPYARAEPGTAGPFVKGAKGIHRLAGLSLALVLSVPWFGLIALYALALGYVCTHLFGQVESKRLGGITGDLIGANSQLCELVLLGGLHLLSVFMSGAA